jgi:uncharacterized protein (TIGR00661 family)
VLVYQTSDTNLEMIPILKNTNLEYRIYGMNGRSTGKIKFMKFDEKGFIDDMRKAMFVIINGGFTTLSEALYLRKPILANPIEDQYEQFFNGYSLKRQGYGDYTVNISEHDIYTFLKNLPRFKKKLDKMKWDNELVFKLI